MKLNKILITVSFFILAVIFVVAVFFPRQIKKAVYGSLCPDCNIILISVDTLGANHLPCYGYDRNTAPNLCRYASDNVLFRNSFSNAPWTLPSHFSIFTGLYPKHHGMELSTAILDENKPTLTEILKENGYSTIYVGPAGDPYLPLNKGLGRGFDQKFNVDLGINNWDNGYQRFLKNSKNGRKSFMFLHTYWVHAPYFVDNFGNPEGKRIFTQQEYPKIITSYNQYATYDRSFMNFVVENRSNELPDPAVFRKINSLDEFGKEFRKLPFQIQESLRYNYYLVAISADQDTIEYARALYDELIVYFDKNLGNFLGQLKKDGLDRNTIIVITSDHGEQFMEHGFPGHPADQLYNSVTSVPIVFHIPMVGHKTITDPVQSIDIVPTILDLVGGRYSYKTHFDGIDLADLIDNRIFPEKNKYLISQGINDSIREGRWKLYVNYLHKKKAPYELYDLSTDLSEKNNVAKSDLDIVDKLNNDLNRIIYKK